MGSNPVGGTNELNPARLVVSRRRRIYYGVEGTLKGGGQHQFKSGWGRCKGEKLNIKKAEPINCRMRKLFKDKLAVRFYLGANHFAYLLSERGWQKYQEAQKIEKFNPIKKK